MPKTSVRKEKRASGVIASIFMVILLNIAVGWIYFGTEVLKPSEIRISGCEFLSDDYVRQKGGFDGIKNILNIDKEEIKESIMSDNRIKSVELTRSFPLILNVAIEEKEPSATLKIEDRFYLIDCEGIVLKVMYEEEQIVYPYIEIVGISSLYREAEKVPEEVRGRIEGVLSLREEAEAVNADYRFKYSFDLEVLEMEIEDKRAILGNGERIKEKIKVLETCMAHREKFKGYGTINVSCPEYPVALKNN